MTDKIDDTGNILITGHLLIRDVDTKEILVNKSLNSSQKESVKKDIFKE